TVAIFMDVPPRTAAKLTASRKYRDGSIPSGQINTRTLRKPGEGLRHPALFLRGVNGIVVSG
ncbi:MAG TPA: hypothetical protein VJR23_15340, partial [Candidatus Acidoferrales bacterium]|nr:hypothetical protein [Candidatus Acidoferrales bacterium]